MPKSRPATLLKKRLRRRFFPVNFAKFLRTPLDDRFCKPLIFLGSQLMFTYENSKLTEIQCLSG